MAWTSPRTWSAGETVTETIMNTHVRDNLKAIGDAWTAYTPTWTGASGNPAIGNGTTVGRYIQAGKLVNFYITITMGSTTTFGSGTWGLTLPVAPVANRLFSFSGTVNDASSVGHPIWAVHDTGSDLLLRTDPTTAGATFRGVTATSPMTWTTSDRLYIGGTYEAA